MIPQNNSVPALAAGKIYFRDAFFEIRPVLAVIRISLHLSP